MPTGTDAPHGCAVSELSEFLNSKLGDRVADDIVREASRHGYAIDRTVVYNALNGNHAKKPREETLQALAAGFGVDVRMLRELVGRQPGELGPWKPVPEAAALTKDQRDALDRLIRTIVSEGGSDAGNTGKKSPSSGEPGGTVTALPDWAEPIAAHEQRPGDAPASKDRPSGDE